MSKYEKGTLCFWFQNSSLIKFRQLKKLGLDIRVDMNK